jgi:hypothetical protein
VYRSPPVLTSFACREAPRDCCIFLSNSW